MTTATDIVYTENGEAVPLDTMIVGDRYLLVCKGPPFPVVVVTSTNDVKGPTSGMIWAMKTDDSEPPSGHPYGCLCHFPPNLITGEEEEPKPRDDGDTRTYMNELVKTVKEAVWEWKTRDWNVGWQAHNTIGTLKHTIETLVSFLDYWRDSSIKITDAELGRQASRLQDFFNVFVTLLNTRPEYDPLADPEKSISAYTVKRVTRLHQLIMAAWIETCAIALDNMIFDDNNLTAVRSHLSQAIGACNRLGLKYSLGADFAEGW